MSTRLRLTALLALLAAPGALVSTASSALAASTGGVSGSPALAPAPALAPSPHRGAVATWFGPGFYGQRTACGQILTPLTLGLANRTLPCGTLVAVSYRGRSVILPVIDRGPYANNAVWDLTGGAARALGISDTVRIAAHVVGVARNTPTLGLPPGSASPASPPQSPAAHSAIARSGGTSAA